MVVTVTALPRATSYQPKSLQGPPCLAVETWCSHQWEDISLRSVVGLMCDVRDIQQGKQITGVAAPTENQEMQVQVDAQQGVSVLEEAGDSREARA